MRDYKRKQSVKMIESPSTMDEPIPQPPRWKFSVFANTLKTKDNRQTTDKTDKKKREKN